MWMSQMKMKTALAVVEKLAVMRYRSCYPNSSVMGRDIRGFVLRTAQ
jgi:hypothetical protein